MKFLSVLIFPAQTFLVICHCKGILFSSSSFFGTVWELKTFQRFMSR